MLFPDELPRLKKSWELTLFHPLLSSYLPSRLLASRLIFFTVIFYYPPEFQNAGVLIPFLFPQKPILNSLLKFLIPSLYINYGI